MTGSARSDSPKNWLIRRQSVSVASEWSQPYSARGAANRTPSRTTSASGVPIRCSRIASLASRPTSRSSMAAVRLANSSGRMLSAGGSAMSTNTWPSRIWTG